MRCKKGFTLIEVMIAILILAGMSTITAIAIQRGAKLKVKLEKEIDDDSQLREVVALISRDINLAFHWTDINDIVKKQISNEYRSQNKPEPFPTPQNGITPIPTEKLTYFVGDNSSLYFTTLSNERTQKDSPESDQAKIGYFLKAKRSYKDQKTSQALFRSVSTYLDGDYRAQGKETALIENVKTLKFRYLPDDVKDFTDSDFVDNWKSVENEDARQKNKFPAAVEVTLVIEKDGKTNQIKTLVAIHYPANNPFKFPEAKPATLPNNVPAGGGR